MGTDHHREPRSRHRRTAEGERDDLLEKLALAVDVTEAGFLCDVLIVPVLPAPHATIVAKAIAEHAARSRGDARALQARLRARLRPVVAPAVLDDLVLFWNPVRHK